MYPVPVQLPVVIRICAERYIVVVLVSTYLCEGIGHEVTVNDALFGNITTELPSAGGELAETVFDHASTKLPPGELLLILNVTEPLTS